jgi:hypothetical protein
MVLALLATALGGGVIGAELALVAVLALTAGLISAWRDVRRPATDTRTLAVVCVFVAALVHLRLSALIGGDKANWPSIAVQLIMAIAVGWSCTRWYNGCRSETQRSTTTLGLASGSVRGHAGAGGRDHLARGWPDPRSLAEYGRSAGSR